MKMSLRVISLNETNVNIIGGMCAARRIIEDSDVSNARRRL